MPKKSNRKAVKAELLVRALKNGGKRVLCCSKALKRGVMRSKKMDGSSDKGRRRERSYPAIDVELGEQIFENEVAVRKVFVHRTTAGRTLGP